MRFILSGSKEETDHLDEGADLGLDGEGARREVEVADVLADGEHDRLHHDRAQRSAFL